MSQWRTLRKVPNACLKCGALQQCFGGCRVTAECCTHDEKGEDPWMIGIVPKLENTRKLQVVVPLKVKKLSFKGQLRWREETPGNFIIASARGNRNLTMVNKELLDFVVMLNRLQHVKIDDLARISGCAISDSDFQRTLNVLATREFINLA